tara:strand:+ start:368 stop:958 length:591 start_codon:yes stop_codon:yes gene_type:complete
MTNKKPNFILDLDQTIISAETCENFDKKKYETKSKLFKFHDMDGLYYIFERPNLQNFLNELFNKFNVSVWTAASKDYALFIINKIILKNKNRKLDWIFFDYHCDISKKLTDNTKSLKILWENYKFRNYNKNNTVILDDYDEVWQTQNSNCIIAKPFEFKKNSSEHDQFLNNLIKKLDKIEKNMKNKEGNPSEVVNS